MYTADETVLISALEHYSYCPRQCALIHVERIFDENVFTLKGRHAHERVDSGVGSTTKGVRVERGTPLWSDALGIAGKADAIEFHDSGAVVPVEYKSGARRASRHDDLQLCAQALCLEEMLHTAVGHGAIYSINTRRRREVVFDNDLRDETMQAIANVRALLNETGALPPALNDGRCPHCSLIDACVPATIVKARETRLKNMLYAITEAKD
jgi:CRISPR-associated exonuclease Cas4